jgi:predicted secreted protein
MRLTSVLAIYLLFWFLCLFLVLPWNVKTSEEAGEPKVAGQADSAPHAFQFGRVMLWTTIVAAIAFAVFYWLYVNYLFDRL